MLKRFKNYLLEMALPLSLYKQYARNWKPDPLLMKIFSWYDTGPRKGKKPFRIYLPYDNTRNFKKLEKESKTAKDVIPAMDEIFYFMYEQKIVKKLFHVENYILGIATTDDGKTKMKIGKLLNMAIKKIPEDADYKTQMKKNARECLRLFENDSKRKNTKNAKYMVVISNHAYDILGKSTNRGWRSCMNLLTGSNAHYIYAELQNRVVMAYLIKENDPNIENPVARLQINCYVNTDDPKKMLFLPSLITYGSSTKEFENVVWNWCNDVNKRLNGDNYLNNVYRVPAPCYTNDFPSKINPLVLDDNFFIHSDYKIIAFILKINDYYILKKLIKDKKHLSLFHALDNIIEYFDNKKDRHDYLKIFFDLITPKIFAEMFVRGDSMINKSKFINAMISLVIENKSYSEKFINSLIEIIKKPSSYNKKFIFNAIPNLYNIEGIEKLVKYSLENIKNYEEYLSIIIAACMYLDIDFIDTVKKELGIKAFFEIGDEEMLFMKKDQKYTEEELAEIIRLDDEKDIFTWMDNFEYKIQINPKRFLEIVEKEYDEKHIKELINGISPEKMIKSGVPENVAKNISEKQKLTIEKMVRIGIPKKLAKEFVEKYSYA